ncbi:transposase [Streptomyces sp900105755]|uniref:Transposase n=1 Tax=Streptomyces sp. 900105755 TaxID=3154389 RepID=A0ABV1TY22_9ACTN
MRAAATVPAASRGYDGGKRAPGRKRHFVTDTLGLVLVVCVTAANIGDRDAAVGLLRRLRRLRRAIHPRLGWRRPHGASTVTGSASRRGRTIEAGTGAGEDTASAWVSATAVVSAAEAARASTSPRKIKRSCSVGIWILASPCTAQLPCDHFSADHRTGPEVCPDVRR